MKTEITEDNEITLTLTEEESRDIREILTKVWGISGESELLLDLWGELDYAINSKLEKHKRGLR